MTNEGVSFGYLSGAARPDELAVLETLCFDTLWVGGHVASRNPSPEFEACGVALQERGSRTDEAIALLRRLWSGEPITHSGKHFPMAGVRIHPAPAQPGGPPIIVGGRYFRACSFGEHRLLGSLFRQDVGPFLDRVAAVGTAAEVAARLDAFVAAGARHLLIAPAAAGNPIEAARRFADEVAPLMRSNACCLPQPS